MALDALLDMYECGIYARAPWLRNCISDDPNARAALSAASQEHIDLSLTTYDDYIARTFM